MVHTKIVLELTTVRTNFGEQLHAPGMDCDHVPLDKAYIDFRSDLGIHETFLRK